MTTPETIVPTRPEDKIITSTIVNVSVFDHASAKAAPGPVKNCKKECSLIIKITMNGYTIAINHVFRSNIFKINAIPKNITKYNNTETIS